jgi:hypothetical protein
MDGFVSYVEHNVCFRCFPALFGRRSHRRGLLTSSSTPMALRAATTSNDIAESQSKYCRHPVVKTSPTPHKYIANEGGVLLRPPDRSLGPHFRESANDVVGWFSLVHGRGSRRNARREPVEIRTQKRVDVAVRDGRARSRCSARKRHRVEEKQLSCSPRVSVVLACFWRV